jgi:hypothetical protein
MFEAERLLAGDFFVSEENLNEIASAEGDNQIWILSLKFTRGLGRSEAIWDKDVAPSNVSHIPTTIQYMPLLERLKLDFVAGDGLQCEMDWTAVKLRNLCQLTISGLDIHYEGLHSLMFSTRAGLKSIKFSKVRLYYDDSTTNLGWAAIFSKIETSCTQIRDVSHMKLLGYTHKKQYDVWFKEDLENWHSLCDFLEEKRVVQGLFRNHDLFMAKHVRVMSRFENGACVSGKPSNAVTSADDLDMISRKLLDIEGGVEKETEQETEDEISEEPEQPIERDIGRELIRNIENEKDQHVEGEIRGEPEQEVGQEYIQQIEEEIGKEAEQDIGQEKTQLIGEEIEEQISKELGQVIDLETVQPDE